MKPKTLILRTAGTNCDGETAHAFELAGSNAEAVHVNRVLREPSLLDQFQILAIPGGFSYGDDIAAGRILAGQLAHHLSDALHAFVDSGRPIIGICNGFQVLIKTDLLPGPTGGIGQPASGSGSSRSDQTCTLTHNDCGRFVDRWVRLAVQPSRCVWTQDLQHASGEGALAEGALEASLLELPIAHGEGKFVPGDDAHLRALHDNKQVVLTYTRADGTPAGGRFPDNPNGSVDDIAGVCDQTGLVFGLMPHPERCVDPTQHPAWTRTIPLAAEGRGLVLFRSAVRHVTESLGAGV